MSTMNDYMVIARVNDTAYITKVHARSLSQAEHIILDQSYCGKSRYSVDGCIAYDRESMKTDAFIGECLHAEPVDYNTLCETIHVYKEYIKREERIAAEIADIEKQIAQLTERLNELKGGE